MSEEGNGGKTPDEVLLELCHATEDAWRTLRKANEAVQQCLLATEEVVAAFANIRKYCHEHVRVARFQGPELEPVDGTSLLRQLAERDMRLAASMLEETARDLLWNIAWGLPISRADKAIFERMLRDAQRWLAEAGEIDAEGLPSDLSRIPDRELAQALRRAATRLGAWTPR